jgi:hypothetical protein
MAYAALAVVLVLFGARFVNKMEDVQALKARAAALRLGNDQLRHQNARLSQAIQLYQTSGYVEEQARAWGFVGPGEVLLLSTLRHAPMQRPRTMSVQRIPAADPIWQQWWQAFFRQLPSLYRQCLLHDRPKAWGSELTFGHNPYVVA